MINGRIYSYTLTVYGNLFAIADAYLCAGSTQEAEFATAFFGGSTTYSGAFTAPATGTNNLSYEFPSNNNSKGVTNADVQLATPEPRSVIFCALLALGVGGVEQRRLRMIFMKLRSKLRLSRFSGIRTWNGPTGA